MSRGHLREFHTEIAVHALGRSDTHLYPKNISRTEIANFMKNLEAARVNRLNLLSNLVASTLFPGLCTSHKTSLSNWAAIAANVSSNTIALFPQCSSSRKAVSPACYNRIKYLSHVMLYFCLAQCLQKHASLIRSDFTWWDCQWAWVVYLCIEAAIESWRSFPSR